MNPRPELSTDLPAINKQKQPPEIIQGYRFRPLNDRQPASASSPLIHNSDWRH